MIKVYIKASIYGNTIPDKNIEKSFNNLNDFFVWFLNFDKTPEKKQFNHFGEGWRKDMLFININDAYWSEVYHYRVILIENEEGILFECGKHISKQVLNEIEQQKAATQKRGYIE